MANTTGQGRYSLRKALQQFDGDAAALLVVPQIKVIDSAKITAYQMSDEDDIVLVNATTAAVTVTLPKADLAYRAKPYAVFKTDSSVNTVTVEGAGAEEVEGAANVVISTQRGSVQVMTPDNLAWMRVGGNGAGASGSAAVTASDVQDFGPFQLDLIGANAAEIRFQVGFAGTLKAIRGISSKAAIATGTAVATASVGGVNCTGGAITWNIADAAGTKKSSTITAGGAFAIGDQIRILISGTNDAAAFAGVTLDYTRS